MAISCSQLTSYANQFLPQFQFADTERVFPIDAEDWLRHCAEGNWTSAAGPHRGTVAVEARVPLSLAALSPLQGCHGANTPIDPTQPLPSSGPTVDEFFLDFAGWPGLQEAGSNDFSTGDDLYIREYFGPYFTQFNEALAEPAIATRNKPEFPTTMAVYCEAAWAGDFTRLDITNSTGDFGNPPTNDPTELTPDPLLDPYFVLTYYLFYPCSEPPPGTATPVASADQLYREGQWEAVSFYFKSTGGPVNSAADLQLASDPSTVTPDYVMLSTGITSSGDGQSPGLGFSYPAQISPPWPAGGQGGVVGGGGLFGGSLGPGPPEPVFVTSGTHKNLFSPTPTKTTTTTDPGWAATGGAFEGAGGVVAGVGATPISWPLIIIGLFLILIGALMQAFIKDSSTSELPNSAGDIASSNGPGAGSTPSASSGSTFVTTNLSIFSTLPDNPECQPPPWWAYPGRWGIAVSSDMSWDSGGRRIDFIGRSRAYWNTVALQTQTQI